MYLSFNWQQGKDNNFCRSKTVIQYLVHREGSYHAEIDNALISNKGRLCLLDSPCMSTTYKIQVLLSAVSLACYVTGNSKNGKEEPEPFFFFYNLFLF